MVTIVILTFIRFCKPYFKVDSQLHLFMSISIARNGLSHLTMKFIGKRSVCKCAEGCVSVLYCGEGTLIGHRGIVAGTS